MKKPLLLLSTTLIFSALASGQVTLIDETFDTYTAGDYLCTQSTLWTTWNNAPGTSTDAFVTSAEAAMGPNSIELNSPTGGGPSDLVLDLGNVTGGVYELSFYIQVADSNGAYFNVLHMFAGNNSEWGLETYFSDDGTGWINAGGTQSATFSYTPGAWQHVEVDFDLDNSMASLTIAGNMIHTWDWSLQATGSAGLNQVGAMNVYAAAPSNQSALYYIDEILWQQISGPSSVGEITAEAITAYPNPVNDQLWVAMPGMNASGTQVRLLDLTGKVVADEATDFTAGEVLKMRFDLTDVPNGIYFLQVIDGTQELVRKVVKH